MRLEATGHEERARLSSKRERPELRSVRCVCARCGAHVIARTVGRRLSGVCSVCGSYEIGALDDVEPAAPV